VDLAEVFRRLAEVGRQGLSESYGAGLGRMRPLLARLGQPQAAFPVVIVTGSKGKGSTATFLANLLQHSPKDGALPKIGLFTGPHLHTYRERIRLNGVMIEAAEFVALFEEIWQTARQAPDLGFISRFELLTILALAYFARQGVDLAVMEVGMGGIYDAVNIVENSPLAVFTPIELEHAAILGPTLADIVRHKSGIMRPNAQAVTSRQTPDVAGWLQAAAQALKVDFHFAREFWNFRPGSLKVALEDGRFAQSFTATGPGSQPGDPDYLIKTRLAGTFQVENALVALAAANLLQQQGLTGAPHPAALLQAALPGRFELAGENPVVLLDAAHTPNAIRELVQTLASLDVQPTWVLGFLKDKNIAEMLRLLPLENRPVFLTEVHSRRKAAMPQVLDSFEQNPSSLTVSPTLAEALDEARSIAAKGPGGLVCLTGSLYLVAEARATLGLLDPATAAEAHLIAEVEAL
jgi:dihydrofolate synthase/folylpolyglutamate synthase